MNIMIVGGAGFIGSNLAEALLKQGHSVFVIDNLSTGKLSNISEFLDPMNMTLHTTFEQMENRIIDKCHNVDIREGVTYYSNRFGFVITDICDYDHGAHGMFAPDFIYNLASPASPAYYFKDPFAPIKANTQGAMVAVDLASRFNCPIIYSSTSEVYGDPEYPTQRESDLGRLALTSPRACYDYAKKLGEVIHYRAAGHYGVDARVVRLFNVYGPKCNREDGRVVSNFIFRAINDEPLEIHGSGQQTRSFIYIDDMVEALIKLKDVPRWEGAVNIGNPQEYSIEAIADCVGSLHGEIITKKADAYPDDPKRRLPCIDKLQTLINWMPTTNLSEGLIKTYNWALNQ